MSSFAIAVDQTRMLSKRSILGEVRNPVGAIMGLFFPLMMTAVYSAQFQRAIGLPGFPEVDGFLDFVIVGAVLQAVALGASGAGAELARDIEDGFFDRLVASPVSRTAILLSKLAGACTVALFKMILLLAIFLAFGASIKGGVAGAVVLVLTGVALTLGLGSLSLVLAIRTGSQEAVQSTFPLVFVLLFISSAFFPTELMTGWYRQLAELNPVTWVIDPLRRLVIEDWDLGDALTALGLPLAIAAVGLTLAVTALEHRLRAQ